MNLSPHFTLAEMTKTSVPRYRVANGSPPPDLVNSGTALCKYILEPIREHFGAPVVIHSGYRCKGLNEHIGGSSTSQHLLFEAADFHIPGLDLEKVFNWISRKSGLLFGQCILEGNHPEKPTWIHISLGYPWRPKASSGQLLKFDGTRYTRL